MRHAILLPALLLSCLSSACGLDVGFPAPPIKVETMLKGEAVDLSKGVHVVEFWATWCGPCKAAIPHLTELAKTYQGKVDFTGVDVCETGEDQLGRVRKFVESMGEKMDYNVAFDGDAGVMYKSFVTAVRQQGLPMAFLIKDGIVYWFGHSTFELELSIEQTLAGKLNVAAKAEKDPQEAEQDARDAVTGPIGRTLRAGKYEEAVAMIDKVEASHPEMMDKLVMGRSVSLQALGSPRVKADAQNILDGRVGRDATRLDNIAGIVLNAGTSIPHPDYEAVLRLAERAAKLSGMENSEILDTYALALSEAGDKKKAAEVQTRAVEIARAHHEEEGRHLQELQDRLEEYRKTNG